MSAMDSTGYVIRNGRVTAVSYRDLMDLVETTTRPDGIGTKYYVTEQGGKYCTAYWSTWGGPEVILSRYDTQEQAQEAIEDIWADQITNSPHETLFSSSQEAEEFLASE